MKQIEKTMNQKISRRLKRISERFEKSPALLLVVVGILMMAYGIFRGEMEVVFHKGIQICLECIGVG